MGFACGKHDRVRGLRLYMKHDRMLTKHYLCESKHFYKTGSSNSEVDVALITFK